MARPWALDGPTDYAIGHVRAVLPDAVLDDARVVVREGRIAEVGPHPAGFTADADGGGCWLLPGLIDVHSDVLAREAQPRPGVTLPPEVALDAARDRMRAAGVTTTFHGLAYQSRSAVGLEIGSPRADELAPSLDAAGEPALHRLDVRSGTGRALLEQRLAALPRRRLPIVVSHEDHTPGQGQYADPVTMRRWLENGEGMSPERAHEHVEWWRATRDERLDQRADTLAWLGSLAAAGRIVLFGHDPETAQDAEQLRARGGRVAEFPTTLAAARAARDLGLLVVAGAPNVVRGGSHAGNVSAAALVADGLVDALASDYLPWSLLSASVHLAASGLLPLPRAVGLVTGGPAACVGLADRGALAPGLRADLLLADLAGTRPRVLSVLTASHPCSDNLAGR